MVNTRGGRLLPLASVLLAACTNMGNLPHGTETHTSLDRANFRMVKANVRGEDSGSSG